MVCNDSDENFTDNFTRSFDNKIFTQNLNVVHKRIYPNSMRKHGDLKIVDDKVTNPVKKIEFIFFNFMSAQTQAIDQIVYQNFLGKSHFYLTLYEHFKKI